MIEFALTERRKKLLLYRGFEYIRDKKDETKIVWKCRDWYKERCRGRLHVSRYRQDKILKSISHNHVPDSIRTAITKERSVLAEIVSICRFKEDLFVVT